MPRPESPLDCAPQRRALAESLRATRAATGLTYAEMATTEWGLSPATLKRIASGNGPVPKRDKVLTYVNICLVLGGSDRAAAVFAAGQDVYRLWGLARQEERGTLGVKPLAAEFIRDRGDLSYALYALYESIGAPSLRELRTGAGGPPYLPLTTTAQIVTRQTLPADTKQYKAFLAGCGITEGVTHYRAWIDAWYKVMLDETPLLARDR
ncbi:helix-turn-helix domain-containing protein [Streptomyces sp. NPDC094154]|uniref:helix-turn-helix domain-containing protein n=1 Tax=Streptomyces sp. NPDC094154 TaxID=3366059 RepID=UPI00380AF04E